MQHARNIFPGDTDLRARVQRLLRGDIREHDLHRLFYRMREEAEGKGILAEVAHFLAHPTLRTKGLATQEARDFFAFLKFRMPLASNPNPTIVTTDLPATVPAALRANLRRMRKSTLKREAKTNPVHAKRVLERILARMISTSAGGVAKPLLMNSEECAVFVCVGSNLKGGPFFTDNDLFKDFARILQRLGVLQKSELSALEGVKPSITLFALTAMHNRVTDLGDATTATLAIAPDLSGNLAVFAFSDVLTVPYNIKRTTVGAWIFATALPIADFCEPGIAPKERRAFTGDFEITPQQKLARLA